MRTLSQQEIQRLEENRCKAQDWQQVSVGENFSADNLYGVEFHGPCSVGNNNGIVTIDNGITLPAGIHNARIVNSDIGDNCLIENISSFIYDTDIEDDCVVCNVRTIQTTEGTTFGQGNTISVMNEGGEGNVVLFSELTSQIAALTVLPPYLGGQDEDSGATASKRKQAKEAIRRMVMEEVKRTVPKRTRIGRGAKITDTTEITNSWIGEGSEIRGARRISEHPHGRTRQRGVHRSGSDMRRMRSDKRFHHFQQRHRHKLLRGGMFHANRRILRLKQSFLRQLIHGKRRSLRSLLRTVLREPPQIHTAHRRNVLVLQRWVEHKLQQPRL